MSAERLLLSDKYKAFLRCDAPVEFLEGTTAAGKTTVGLFKFMLKVAESPKKLHILAADDTGAAEKNIIQKDLTSVYWWSTKVTAEVVITCPTSSSTHPAVIR